MERFITIIIIILFEGAPFLTLKDTVQRHKDNTIKKERKEVIITQREELASGGRGNFEQMGFEMRFEEWK